VDEVMDEAHLGPEHILEAISRYAAEADERRARMRALVDGIGRER
jgi:hypothetical protein